jgi:hypothetical protein
MYRVPVIILRLTCHAASSHFLLLFFRSNLIPASCSSPLENNNNHDIFPSFSPPENNHTAFSSSSSKDNFHFTFSSSFPTEQLQFLPSLLLKQYHNGFFLLSHKKDINSSSSTPTRKQDTCKIAFHLFRLIKLL